MEAYHHATIARTMDVIGVDPEDALHAAAACQGCMNAHAVALTSRKCWERPLPEAPRVTIYEDANGLTDSEGKE